MSVIQDGQHPPEGHRGPEDREGTKEEHGHGGGVEGVERVEGGEIEGLERVLEMLEKGEMYSCTL